MRKPILLRIVEALGNHYKYFMLGYDALGRRGLTSVTKCHYSHANIGLYLGLYMSVDCVDEYLKISKSTTSDCLKIFYSGKTRKPTLADVNHLLEGAEAYDLLGSLGNIDCMY